MYRNDFIIKALCVLQLWPRHDEENDKYFSIKRTFLLPFYTFMALGSVSHMIHSLLGRFLIIFKTDSHKYISTYYTVRKVMTEPEIVEDLTEILSFTGMAYIMGTFLWSRTSISELLNDLYDFEKFGKPEDIQIVRKKYNRFSLTIIIFTTATALVYTLFAFLGYNDCMALNHDHNLNNVCGLVTYTWVPFDINYFPAKQIYVLCQTILTLFAGNGASACTLLIYCNIEVLVCRIQHLIRSLQMLQQNKDLATQRKLIVLFVLYHTDIKRQVSNFLLFLKLRIS